MSLDYQSVPNGFVYCLSDKCKQKNNCIRSEAYQKLPANDNATINIVNPKYIENSEGDDCRFL